MIRTENLTKFYGSRCVVNGTEIKVKKGEVVGLLGPNGAGKTTTFYMITGMVQPNKGHVFFNDTEITNLPMFKRARLGIGYLPQETSVFRDLTVEQNLQLVLELLDLSKAEQQKKLESLLAQFSIEHIRKTQAKNLSGGEKRRTEIARCLVLDPQFILLDEPFAGIDPIAVEDIQSIIRLLKRQGVGILITDHNVRETLSITDRSYLLYDGQVLKSGKTKDLISDEKVKKLYLGSHFKMDDINEE
ncbi:MAG: LPS export ABC transporter ATP-binding protein [bacterium TMED198]|nr:MAG: LPS export ABC transporter ATP-binding protein [bacterium TMED198]|tara:strand:- start:40 stop:774 length:735 start_codon:yes stop_codon:yes gene_type:complete